MRSPIRSWDGRSFHVVKMKVLFLPSSNRSSNPYQWELADALGKHGVDVVLSRGIGKLPILGAVRTSRKPDVIHLHWTHGFIVASSALKTIAKGLRFLLELALLKLMGIKVVWTVHNLLQHERQHPRLELLFTRIAVRLYDHLIVHCETAKEAVIKTYRLSQTFKKKISVIPHGNYLGCYENSISRSVARERLGFQDEHIVFLYIGQIRPYKGVPLLMDTFLNLRDPRARLLIAGKPATDQLKEEIEERAQRDSRIILRLTFIPDNEVQLYLNAADVVVLPYRDILTSGAAILAMSFGRPVIAPRLGCMVETIDEGKGGYLYDPKQEGDLFRAMQEALKADLAAMGKYNLNKVRKLDWDEIARMTLEVYKSVLRR